MLQQLNFKKEAKMLISLFRYLQGYLKICVTGYSPERFLNLCKNKKIAIWGLEPANNHYEMYMKIDNFYCQGR